MMLWSSLRGLGQSGKGGGHARQRQAWSRWRGSDVKGGKRATDKQKWDQSGSGKKKKKKVASLGFEPLVVPLFQRATTALSINLIIRLCIPLLDGSLLSLCIAIGLRD